MHRLVEYAEAEENKDCQNRIRTSKGKIWKQLWSIESLFKRFEIVVKSKYHEYFSIVMSKILHNRNTMKWRIKKK